VRQGAEADFRGWAVEHRSGLRATAFLLSGDWHLAEDLAQETLARLFSVWDRVAGSGDPSAYARRVLLNLYLDQRKKPWRREESYGDVPDRAAPHQDGVDGPRDDLIAALRDVPPGQRAVLVLRYWEDLSVEQTAAALNTSSGNVKSQAARGLVALREALARRGLADLIPTAGETS